MEHYGTLWNIMEQATYQQLQDMVHELTKKNQALTNNLTMATERIEYCEDIATKQNECILMQSDRYDYLEDKYKEKVDATDKKSKPLETQITELNAKNERWETRCTNLDDRLADYEDSYKSLRYKKEEQDEKLENAKETIEQLGFYVQKEEAMTSLLLQELKKYKIERVEDISYRQPQRRTPKKCRAQ